MEPRQETPVVENKVLSPAEVKNIIEELTRQNSRMAIIQQIAKRINVEMSYDDIIDEVAAPLRSVLPYDLLSFCLLEKGRLIIKSGVPKEQKILGVGWILDRHNSAPWKAIMDKHCFLRQDIWNDPHKYQEDDNLRELGIKSAIMAPLLVNNEVIGALNFGSKETYVYSENDFIFVQQLADQLQLVSIIPLIARSLQKQEGVGGNFQSSSGKLFLIDLSYNVLRSNSQDPVAVRQGSKC